MKERFFAVEIEGSHFHLVYEPEGSEVTDNVSVIVAERRQPRDINKAPIVRRNGLRLRFPIVHSLVPVLFFRSTPSLTSRTKRLTTLLWYGFHHRPCNWLLLPKEYALTMPLLFRSVHIAFVRLNIQIFHFFISVVMKIVSYHLSDR
jgi:hypothetical protein